MRLRMSTLHTTLSGFSEIILFCCMSLDVVDGVFMSLGFRALPIIENEEEKKKFLFA